MRHVEPDDLVQLAFARQRGLSGFGAQGQDALAASRIAIVGMGGLGCPVALYLVAAGVGGLTLIDSDSVSATNLHRQVLYGPADVGSRKVAAAARALGERAPWTTVTAIDARLTAHDAAPVLAGHDVIVDATDTFASRRLIAAAAREHHAPLVWGAVTGWHGQVTVFDGSIGLDDVFPDDPDLAFDSCDGGPVLGTMCGQVGTAMATEAVKLAAGAGTSLAGTLAILDARTGRWRDVPVKRRVHA